MKIFKRKDKKHKQSWGKIIKIIIVILVIVVAGYLILWQTGVLETLKIARQIQQQQQLSAEDQEILKELKQSLLLPEDTKPTMAVITDVQALRENQPNFFANAENGHRLIIYPTMAIVYDAQANKIIKVGPVNFNQSALQQVNVALYNGSGNDQRLNEFEEKLTSTFNNVEINVREAAANTYNNTLVIDLTGENQNIQEIAEALGGQVSELPEGEAAPEGAAILVIVGRE
ncbi:MAG: hypothetical protein GF365_01610 [Candidatus Buchananbacteria bacterium]|nr:hypothetical protein [Candidatus Buchananbacteria bacterium]